MSASPQQPVVDDPEAPAGAYSPQTPVPAARAPRTFSVRVTAAIGAGALVVGAALGMLTGGLVGPGGPGGGPGGTPPGMSQDGTGTQGTVPGAATDGSTTQGSTTGT